MKREARVVALSAQRLAFSATVRSTLTFNVGTV